MLPPVPHLDGKKIRGWYSPTALAFLGDSIWEVCLLPSVNWPAVTAIRPAKGLSESDMPSSCTCISMICLT